MPFTRHLVLTQVIIASVEDALSLDGCRVFVDTPLNQQVDISPVGMLKLVLCIQKNMGQSILPHRLTRGMSVNEMVVCLFEDSCSLKAQVSI
jgi:hypothetical protein